MLNFIIAVALVALISSFIIDILIIKKIAQKLQNHKIRIISKLFECHFCMSFWMSVVLSIVACVLLGSCVYLFVPLFSTNLSKILI